jgi:hypothetical protein
MKTGAEGRMNTSLILFPHDPLFWVDLHRTGSHYSPGESKITVNQPEEAEKRHFGYLLPYP